MKNKKKKGIKVTEEDNRPLLELVMIVKNASTVIEDTLKSALPFVDHFTILDTGSTDNTIEIIKNTIISSSGLVSVKGNLYQEPFIDFSTTRNRALDLAGTRCKYTIFLDDTYHLKGGERLRRILSERKDDCFDLRIFNKDEKRIYYSTRILATNCNYRYRYRVHEIPDTKYPGFKIRDDSVQIEDATNLFTVQRSKARFKRDIQGLLQDLGDNPADVRTLYYLGLTYTMIEDYENARIYFLKHIQRNRSRDEYLYNAYYHLGLILYRLRKDWKEIEDNLKKAIDIYPNRAEPYYKIASNYYREGDIQTAYSLLIKIKDFPIPKDFTMEVELDIYNIKIPYLFLETSLILLSQGVKVDTIECSKLLQKLLEENPGNMQFHNIKEIVNPSNPPNITRYNNVKTVVIHTAFFQGQIWDPKEFRNSLVSGSEIMARNMAIELAKIGYRVTMFGHFQNNQTDYQCIYNDVEFLDVSLYLDWIKTHYVNTLIVSRFPTNVLYLPNIEKVYLWMHDTFPDYEYIQAHKTKFKGVLSLCNWHKKLLMKEFNIPDNMVIVTRNALYTERFEKQVEKVPYRFMWSSDPSRGLTHLLKMMPKIKANFPQTTLYIFANVGLISDSDLEFIKSTDYIFLEGRKSQEEIAVEYLKSDIWLYPTDFEETYCITAVEAQLAGCLCITLDIGSLSEIVGDRGIVVKGKVTEEKTIDNLLEYINLVLEEPEIKEEFTSKAKEWAEKQTFKNLALDWSKYLL